VYGGVVDVMVAQGGDTSTQHVENGIVTTVNGSSVSIQSTKGGTITQYVGNGMVSTVNGSSVSIQSVRGGNITQHFGPLK
jgi:hypothetical protein